ncbi:MAG TPA: PAS domain-containing sensor histidine kinase [Flavobacteriaceae bacterium]|jgi:PAS domain S-box-containing protein|nr:PAS domain-containing sensor histidine kinase [Flavobacteriaceae bacterium]HIN99934.1 PAS domain-containing sensor histidine kinase [Flavobacteriaceae bacterium]|tara:strand:+ start:4679 stop:7105 length:2427 start_codon:yes stop_codon:yes gene_type:complete
MNEHRQPNKMETSSSQNGASLVMGDGEMATRIREKDWSANPLGPISSWPQSLLTSINIILNSKFPMFIFWGEHHICFYNDAYRPSLGMEGMHPDMLGTPGKEAWGDAIFDTVAGPKVKLVKETGVATWNKDFLVPIYRNGKIEDVYWTFSYSPIYDENSEISGVLVTVMETTDNVVSLQRLEEKSTQLNFAIEGGDLATFSYLPQTDELSGNKRFKEWFGLINTEKGKLHEIINSAIIKEDRERVAQAVMKAQNYESGGHYDIVYTIHNHKMQQERVVQATGKFYFNEQKEPFRFNGIIQDITTEYEQELKLIETLDALRESKSELQFAIEAADLATWDLNPIDNKFKGNDRLKEWFGLKKTDVIPLKKAMEVIIPEDRPRVQAAIENALNFETDHHYDIIYTIKRTNDGKERVVRALGRAWFNKDNQPYRFNGTLQDITDQYYSEKKLKEAFFKIEESEKRFRRVANNAPVFIKITDLEGKVIFANQPWLDFIGSSLDQHLGSIAFTNTHPEDVENCRAVFEESYYNQSDFKLEYRVKRFDGRYRWMVNKGAPRYGVNGEFEGYIHAFMNIHEIKLQEKQKDLFIGMASHELKTPVTSMKGYVQLLSAKYKNSDDEFLKKALHTIDKQILVLTSLITDLLNLSKMKRGGLQLNKTFFDINELLEINVSQIRMVNPTHIIDLSKTQKIQVYADKERLGQVITNFLTNAVKYAPNSKNIEVSASVQDDKIRVAVRDYGIGIKEENRERIFKRFYREEGRDENTFPGFGIGLYIAADIIKKHKGTIGVESEKGQGSTFYFTIPIQEETTN